MINVFPGPDLHAKYLNCLVVDMCVCERVHMCVSLCVNVSVCLCVLCPTWGANLGPR